LNDASALKRGSKKGAWLDDEQDDENKDLTINIPVRKPKVEIPVIEIFLK
jgi:hypothetical protein